ncbi:F-box/kelch-repeat protein At3g23880-like [Vigna umbellata]|uniref:F-box/kelch-repeat protein At3g23880-like n=1 Tax=Vigna umbellata TaxID=87088 RepID=UPI001F5F5BF4|nr:F-box/kelch-repeat protein At3g23880-like [Vigna umbellata]
MAISSAEILPHELLMEIMSWLPHWVCFWNPATNICSGPSPSLLLYYGNARVQHYMYFGFGYDDRRDRYKVVAMVLDWTTLQKSMWVYCMGDVCWRCPLMTSPGFYPFDSNGYSMNGTVNWIGISLEKSKFEVLQIFSYDLKNDTCRYLSVPQTKDSEFTAMGVFNGCLCVSCDQGMIAFVVLALKDVRDERSWSQLLSVSYETLKISPCYHNLRILFMWGDLLLLTCSEFGGAYNIISIFNLKENKVKRTQGYFKSFVGDIFCCHYAPSLILPI